MELLRDGVLTFLASVGLAALVWLAAGVLFRPGRPVIPGLLLVLPLRGEAGGLEQAVRELNRLQLPGGRIVLADCGMEEEARCLARYLADRGENITLRSGGEPLIS